MTHWTSTAIRELRAELRLGIGDLAARSGVSANTISNIENGKSLGRIDSLEKLCIAMGYEIDMIRVADAESVEIE